MTAPFTVKKLVIVVDDQPRWWRHVWSYLSRSVRIGRLPAELPPPKPDTETTATTPVPEGTTTAKAPDPEPVSLTTDDGEITVMWIPAGAKSVSWLRAALQGRNVDNTWVLIDRSAPQYNPEEDTFKEAYAKNATARFVSAYPAAAGSDKWEPKNVETLERLRQEVRGAKGSGLPAVAKHEFAAVKAPPPPDEERKKQVHILITGAGFELAGPGPGRLGTEMTATLMDNTVRALKGRRLGYCARLAGDKEWAFTLPAIVFQRTGAGLERKVPIPQDPLDGQDLDEWWNRVLLANAAIDARTRVGDNYAFGPALQAELDLRNAFRAAFYPSDWGLTGQHIHAALLPFEAWINTNYSGLADRAINAVRFMDDAPRAWEMIASGQAARRLRESLQHKNDSAKIGSESTDRTRYMFKVHGDITRVDTMALAGLDKAQSSPLLVRPDGLHDIYSVAERYMSVLAGEKANENADLHIHVVGHGLADTLLNETLERIVRHWKGSASPRPAVASHCGVSPGRGERSVFIWRADYDVNTAAFMKKVGEERTAVPPPGGAGKARDAGFHSTAPTYMAALHAEWRHSASGPEAEAVAARIPDPTPPKK